MNRRKLLMGGAGLAVAGAVGYLGAVGAGALRGCPREGQLVALEGLQAIGSRYLSISTAEEVRELRRVALRPEGQPRVIELATAAGEDFARGDVVEVDGWLLARSEARYCAILLLQGRESFVPA